MKSNTLVSSPPLEPLSWDSDHFGLPVARIVRPELDDDDLEAILREARRSGHRLVYWFAPSDRIVPRPLMEEFDGFLADRKATFLRDDLLAVDTDDDPRDGRICRIVEVTPPAVASPQLRALAISAGEHSRFRRDSHLPQDGFRSLYETWIERSAQGELADAILVAVGPAGGDEPMGMVTIAVRGREGSIGLIAVDAAARGLGIGRQLIGAAHVRMRSACATHASVVTQLENIPACRLYERSGYRLGDVRNVYHFWP